MGLCMDPVDRLMHQGIESGIFPGAVLCVATDAKTLFEQSYGAANLFAGVPMTKRTVFDLASLTKPLATALAVMALVRQGRLHLEQPCGEICPQLRNSDKAGITLRQLLNHTAGLPPWRPYYMTLRHIDRSRRKDALRRLLVDEPLLWPPGAQPEYSDLGYMVLQWVAEQASGMDLDAFVSTEVYGPLEIDDLFFNRLPDRRGRPSDYAATQLCPWRCRLMVGCVDDDNAYVQGGVGGHAGLFGTASAVVMLLQALLAADQAGDGGDVFNPRLVRGFLRTEKGERWALGFDTPDAEGSSAGRYFSRESIGHLGFTGTSFWIHRRQGVIVVLLTNRVHPWRFNPGIRQFRPRLHDCIMEALSLA